MAPAELSPDRFLRDAAECEELCRRSEELLVRSHRVIMAAARASRWGRLTPASPPACSPAALASARVPDLLKPEA